MQLVINILVTAALALIAGFACQITTAGFRHFHAGVAVAASAGGYVFVFLSDNGWSVLVAAVMAVGIGAVVGIAFDTVLLATHRRSGLRTLSLFLASLAGWVVVQSLISILLGDNIRGVLVEDRMSWRLLGAVITAKQLLVITVPIFVAVALGWGLHGTSLGLIFRGYCSNPDLTNNFGIPQRLGEIFSGAVGFSCAACAGILETIEFGVAPTSGFRIWLVGTVVFVVAGFGSFNGLIFAALLVSVTSHLMTYWIGGEWIQASMFVVLIAFLLWRPLGMSGRRLKKVEV